MACLVLIFLIISVIESSIPTSVSIFIGWLKLRPDRRLVLVWSQLVFVQESIPAFVNKTVKYSSAFGPFFIDQFYYYYHDRTLRPNMDPQEESSLCSSVERQRQGVLLGRQEEELGYAHLWMPWWNGSPNFPANSGISSFLTMIWCLHCIRPMTILSVFLRLEWIMLQFLPVIPLNVIRCLIQYADLCIGKI